MDNMKRETTEKPGTVKDDTTSIAASASNIISDTTHSSSSLQKDYVTEVEPSNLSAKWSFYNIILLGCVFMTIFTAYQTCAMIQVCYY